MKGYGQFCPVSKAAEILNERWTILIVRELLCGSRRFNDLRRGVPLMSPSLLSHRLKELQEYGIVERRHRADARGGGYRLTPAGEELRPIVMSFGEWGQRWVRSQIHENDLDAGLLMWDMRRTIDAAAFRPERTAVEFDRRLEVLKQSQDGFQIAQADLELRGPGELAGVRQWGMAAYRVARLPRDQELLESARTLARELMSQAAREPGLAGWLAAACAPEAGAGEAAG